MLINIFDTRIADDNLGNAIIMDAIDDIIDECFPYAFILRHGCLDPIGDISIDYIKRGEYSFFGGTNMLNSHMQEYTQWNISPVRHVVADVILLGVGWFQYQDDPDNNTKSLLFDVLHPSVYHSVRDAYTEKKLRKIGFQNILNTGCPTMWSLTPEHCRGITHHRAESVLVTLTSYNQNPKFDIVLFQILKKLYKCIYLWVQGPNDRDYGRSLCPNLEILPPRLEALDDLLSSDRDIEYVGTRLHAGIRALQHKRRTTIIGIDNRALEISSDTGLPVIVRDNILSLREHLLASHETVLRLPQAAIDSWKRQFI